jgi:hypothetical protein
MIFAYLDPGAGSMIFQALLATALAVPLFFRSKVSAIVRRVTGRQEEEASAGAGAGDDTRRD